MKQIMDHKEQLNKNDPLVAYLNNLLHSEIDDLTKKLGNNRLKNTNNMRKWIAQVFSEFDPKCPLDSLMKFMSGNLPELDTNKK